MAKESSVAPKERVNIIYKPATGGAQEEKELPLKLLVLGDYKLEEDETPLEERKPVNVDKDNFNDVMASQGLSLTMKVPDKMVEQKAGEEERELLVNLGFKSMKDFRPESIVENVPELNQLLQLRAALQALKGPLGNIPAFRKRIEGLVSDVSAREKILGELGAKGEEE